MFRVGDKVWSMTGRRGEVIGYSNDSFDEYPVVVRFEDGSTHYYTADGKIHWDGFRDLYFEEFKIEIPKSALRRPTWRAECGDKYCYVNSFGKIHLDTEALSATDNARYYIGNYFKSAEEAKESKFYKVFIDEGSY